MQTVTQTVTINEIIEDFISNQGLKNTIGNFDKLFFYFITETKDECHDDDKTELSYGYRLLKEFLSGLKSDQKGIQVLNTTEELEESIEKLLNQNSLTNLANCLNDIFFYYVLKSFEYSGDGEIEDISWTYKYFKDFLLDLEAFKNKNLSVTYRQGNRKFIKIEY